MDRWDELERLGRLRDEGLLSNEEFEAEKRRLLASNTPASQASAAQVIPTASVIVPEPAPVFADPATDAFTSAPIPEKKKRGWIILAASCAIIVAGVGLGWAYSRSSASTYAPAASDKPTKTNAAKAEAPAKYAFQSQVSGATFEPLTELPTVKPYNEDEGAYCGEPVKIATAGGRIAEKRGWRVVQETKYHDMDAVLVVRGYDPGTSGHCFPKDANLAFFEGGKLLGVLAAAGKNGIGINTVESIGGRLRVWDDLMPVGQIDLVSKTLTFAPVTGTDEVCNGQYRVPTVFGKPYSKARTLLGRAGWAPLPNTEAQDGDERTADYLTRFPETTSCAGTGFAYCAFEMQSGDGKATLSITTAGDNEDPNVVSYDVSCEGRSAG